MDPKFGIIIVLGSLLIMAIYSPITNFVSAANYQCFSSPILGGGICIDKDDPKDVLYCYKDKNDIGNCVKLKSIPTPPEIEQAIQNTINELAPSNPNDSKDLGGMQTDKGITKSPIE